MPLSPSSPPDLDKLLDGTPFRAITRLGGGGMGEIYEASRGGTGPALVVKVLRAEFDPQSDGAQRLFREGEFLQRLHHANIVRTHGHGRTATGRPYLVLERIDGCTLRDELRRRGALPLDEALDYVRQLLAALDAVHDAGIVHRDVKPANVMLTSVGGAACIKLIDFGVAKIAEADPASPPSFATREGVCVGTPRYVSPEQASGIAVDRRSDIYAAGLLLYTLVAGRGPFDEIAGTRRLLAAHRSSEPPPPSSIAKQPVPEAVEAVILRAIAKRPEDRFASAAAFSRELARVHGQVRESRVCARRSPSAARPRSYPKRAEGAHCFATPKVARVSRAYGASRARASRVAEREDFRPIAVGDARESVAARRGDFSANREGSVVSCVATAVAEGLAPSSAPPNAASPRSNTASPRSNTASPRSNTASLRGSPDSGGPPSSRAKPGDRKGAFSRMGVFFSAAAFFAVASALAMWFVR